MEFLIDCDPGIDDSLALCYLFRQKDIHIAGISTVAGNISAAQAAENVLRLLKLTGREEEIPVCVGAEHPLYGKTDGFPVKIHGRNGVADLELPETDLRPVNLDVCDFLYKSACRCVEKPILITLGRLTNVAKTLRRYPDYPEKISRVVSMGGAVFTRGNITPEAEASIYGDPEAAEIAFSAPWDLTLVGLDVTMRTILSRTQIRNLAACNQNPAQGRLLCESLTYLSDFIRTKNPRMDGCPLHDPLAVLAVVEPQLVQTVSLPVAVDCSHDFTRGKVTPIPSSHPIRICTEVNAERAVRLLMNAF